MKSVCEEAYVSSLNEANFRMLYYMQFLDMRCGIGKNCWLDDIFMRKLRLCVHCWFYILQFLK